MSQRKHSSDLRFQKQDKSNGVPDSSIRKVKKQKLYKY